MNRDSRGRVEEAWPFMRDSERLTSSQRLKRIEKCPRVESVRRAAFGRERARGAFVLGEKKY